MKEKQPELIEWKDLNPGDFFRSEALSFFCFKKSEDGKNVAIMLSHGLAKLPFPLKKDEVMLLSKDEVPPNWYEHAKNFLELEYTEKKVDNLSYIEALAALKKYDI
jgi:hypothetical protein